MFNEFDLYRAKKVIRELANAKGIEEKEMRAEMEGPASGLRRWSRCRSP